MSSHRFPVCFSSISRSGRCPGSCDRPVDPATLVAAPATGTPADVRRPDETSESPVPACTYAGHRRIGHGFTCGRWLTERVGRLADPPRPGPQPGRVRRADLSEPGLKPT